MTKTNIWIDKYERHTNLRGVTESLDR